MDGLFVVGSDTDVGKTWVSTLLIQALQKEGRVVGAYKPVASGVGGGSVVADPGSLDDPSDLDDVSKLERMVAIRLDIERRRICPQIFQAPLAPALAAELEGRSVDRQVVSDGFQWWQGKCDFLLVEGAGGLFSPITFQETNLDLVVEFQLPVVLVVRNRLGAVGQAIGCMDALVRRKIPIEAVVLNQVCEDEMGDASQSNERLLVRFIDSRPEYQHVPYPTLVGHGQSSIELQ